MRIGLLGGAGQLGFDIQRAAAQRTLEIDAPGSAELDITSAAAVAAWVQATPRDAYINCAAYTAVDAAEDDVDAAFAVNEAGAAHLADAVSAAARDAPPSRLLYLSTDYVFAGDGNEPWTESAATGPRSVYGASKLAGEQATLRCPGAQVLRVSWVFGVHGHNFVKSILRAASNGTDLAVVDDQFGTPCSAASITTVLLRMLAHPDLPGGVYHFGAEPLTNWREFAAAIVAEGVAAGLLPAPVAVAARTTESLNQRATRPRFSQLHTGKLTSALQLSPQPWREELRAVLAELAATGYQPG